MSVIQRLEIVFLAIWTRSHKYHNSIMVVSSSESIGDVRHSRLTHVCNATPPSAYISLRTRILGAEIGQRPVLANPDSHYLVWQAHLFIFHALDSNEIVCFFVKLHTSSSIIKRSMERRRLVLKGLKRDILWKITRERCPSIYHVHEHLKPSRDRIGYRPFSSSSSVVAVCDQPAFDAYDRPWTDTFVQQVNQIAQSCQL